MESESNSDPVDNSLTLNQAVCQPQQCNNKRILLTTDLNRTFMTSHGNEEGGRNVIETLKRTWQVNNPFVQVK